MNLPSFGTPRTLLIGVVALCAGMSTSAFAAPIQYQVTNLTLSGGDPTFSVATNVTFNSLVLSETFSDTTVQMVPLLDASNAMRTSLDTATLFLTSAAVSQPDPTHGAIVSARLTGSLSQTNLSILTSFGGTPTSVTVLPTFSSMFTNVAGLGTVDLFATNASSGAQYGIGTLSAVAASTGGSVVPEPANAVLLLIGVGGLFIRSRMRTRSRARQACEERA